MSCYTQCGCLVPIGSYVGEIDRLPDTDAELVLVPIKCGIEFNDGRDEPRAWYIDITKVHGMMNFHYESFSKPDRFRLYMDGKMFWDSGCLGTNGYRTKSFYVPKRARRLWIEVIPNCTGGYGTAWKIKTDCPDGRIATNDRLILREYRYGKPFDKDVSVFQPVWSE